MTSSRELRVQINADDVGTLNTQDDIWRFSYARQWQENPLAFPLAPGLPLDAQAFVDGSDLRPVQWYFDNLLPEENLRSVLAKEAEIDEADAFGLLGYFGAESAGSLALSKPGAPPANTGLVPLPLPQLDARIRNLPRATLTQNAPKRMSLAGAQHKMVICLQDGELFEPQPGSPSTHILKPDSQSEMYPHSVINEYFTMRLAATVGLSVPPVQRLYAPAPAYIIERFDRSPTPAGGIQRLHIIDTCQLLGQSRAFKYEQASVDTLALAIRQCTWRAHARVQLFRWVLFNYLIGNGDNHLKNLSFHIDSEGIRLAPFYDLLSTCVYATRAFHDDPVWPKAKLAMTLGKAERYDQVSRATMLEAGQTLGLSAATVARELDKMTRNLPGHADTLIEEIEAAYPAMITASPDPVLAARHQAGEQRLLRSIRHVVLQDTVSSLRKV